MMGAVVKLPEPATPTDDPIGPIADFDLTWLKPERETKYTEVMASLTSSTATTEASQSSQGMFSADGEADDAEPSCKQPKLNGDHAQKDTVGNGGEELLQRVPTPYTGAMNVEQLFAVNTQLLFGANTNAAANPNPITTEPTSAPLADALAGPTSTPNFDAPLGASAADDTTDDTTANPAPNLGAQMGRCHNCGQDGHWANQCTLILSKMIAGRASNCALCPFEVKPGNDVIVKLGCGPFSIPVGSPLVRDATPRHARPALSEVPRRGLPPPARPCLLARREPRRRRRRRRASSVPPPLRSRASGKCPARAASSTSVSVACRLNNGFLSCVKIHAVTRHTPSLDVRPRRGPSAVRS